MQKHVTVAAWVLLASIGSSLFGCKRRAFHQNGELKSAADSTGVFPDSAARIPLHDDPSFPITGLPPHDYAADTLQEPGTEAMGAERRDTMAYERTIVEKRDSSLPHPLAMATVLELMRENRKQVSPIVAGGASNEPAFFGIPLPLVLPEGSFARLSTRSGKEEMSFSPKEGVDSIKSCGNVDAPHWSDITYHYYCQIPALLRACHRGLATVLPGEGRYGKSGELSQRQAIIKLCTGQLAPGDATIPPDRATFVNQAVTLLGPIFARFYATQVRKDPSGKDVNVFDYLMLAQTYAFRYVDQQAVLNAYFGEMKPGLNFNPLNPEDCIAYRPRRGRVDAPSGFHCDPKAKKNMPLKSLGR